MKMFGLDDWIMVTATVLAIVNVVVAGLGTPSTSYMVNSSLICE